MTLRFIAARRTEYSIKTAGSNRWTIAAVRALLLATALVVLTAGCGSVPRARVALASGDLDPAFGGGGTVTRDFFGHTDIAYSVVVTRAGRVLVSGRADRDDYGRGSSVVMAFRDDGSVDPEFGDNGVVRPSLSGELIELRDGRLLQVGSRRGAVAVERLRADGNPDTTFGAGGIQVLARRPFRRSGCLEAEVAAIARRGKIVIAGSVGCGGPDGGAVGVFVARLRADGRIDRSFSRDGVWISYRSCDVADIAVDRHGRVLVGGSTGSSDYCTYGAMVVTRLRPDGVPDAGFGKRGRRLVHFAHARDTFAFAFSRDARGRMLLGGSAGSRLAVARLRANGRPDNAFGRDGRIVGRIGRRRATNYVTSMVEDADGRITLSVADDAHGTARFVIARLRADGSPDPSFGTNGVRTVSFGSDFARAYALARDGQGRVVAAGFAQLKGTDDDFAVARLMP